MAQKMSRVEQGLAIQQQHQTAGVREPSVLSLFEPEPPPPVRDVEIRHCTAETLIASMAGHGAYGSPRLIMADPPWSYENKGSNGAAAKHYEENPIDAICRVLKSAHDMAAPGARLVLWCTWPILARALTEESEQFLTVARIGWKAVTGGHTVSADAEDMFGGTWQKTGQIGIGYHWRGVSEPVLIFAKEGTRYTDPSVVLLNGHAQAAGQHSEKPIDWLQTMLQRWTRPGDLVADLYGGMSPLARAAVLTNRRCIVAEADEERHRQAEGLLRTFISKQGLWADRCG